jgi:hypothetical protein
MMKTRADYDRAISAVRDLISRWDPYSLLACGAPADEFDSEVQSVVAQISRIRSANDAAHVISRVFSSAFEPSLFKPEDCTEIGRELFRTLTEQELLTE